MSPRAPWPAVVVALAGAAAITACGASVDPGGPDSGSNDAGPETPDAAPDATSYEPSPANLGWIGGACDQSADCADVPDGFCLTDGFANGHCTAECFRFCPDRFEPGDTVSACVDGRPFGFDEGLCAARCDASVLPGTGCPDGYRCDRRQRYGDPYLTLDVCVPLAPPRDCDVGEDELIAVNYPDRGALWIPGEAQCGGAFDLVIMMHGINPSNVVTPSLGGGRQLEIITRNLIDSGAVAPLILAEPVHFEGSSTFLYGVGYDLFTHLDALYATLLGRGITVRSLSFTGHSGAGCDEDNGLYKVLASYDELIPAYASQMALWGLQDVCYEAAYHWQAPLAVLPGTGTVLLDMYSVQGNPAAFLANMFPAPAPMPLCTEALYQGCVAHATEPWCSYRTRGSAGITHDTNPYYFVREAFPQVFSPHPAVSACR